MKIIILAILALAVLANGYRIDTQPPSPTRMNILRTICEQNGANYTEVESAAANFVQCVEVDFEVKMLETEIKVAYMYNSYDAYNTVFKKYCRKTPELKACYHKLLDAMAPCLEGEKKEIITVSNNVNDKILDYLCQDGGYIITAFIMEGGPQCFQEKNFEIMMCTKSTQNSILYMEQNRTLSVTASYRMYVDLLKCIHRSVKTCHNPTPSGIVSRVLATIHRELQNIVQGDSKNDASKTSRKLFKASGNVAVAFNADIYI